MADRITEERLREIVVNGTYCGLDEGHSIAAELLAARAEVEQCIWNMAGISTIACAENLSHYTPGQDWERAALRDVVRLVRRVTELRAEVERLRADLRCALGLLREVWSEGAGDASWSRETFALMELHKETP